MQIKEYKLPDPGARPRRVTTTGDGMVWYTDYQRGYLGRLDPATGQVKEWQSPSGAKSAPYGISTIHDVIWYSESEAMPNTVVRFDPKTEKFTEFPDVPTPYGIELDQQGNLWFAQFPKEGKIGRVDTKTLKVTKWTPPTTERLWELNKNQPDENYGNSSTHPKTSGPRRITVDSQGAVWFTEWWGNQIGRFDPRTETFKEFALPDPDPTPYAIGVDRYGFVWYSSYDDDILGRVNPKTGEVVEFPFPYSGNELREIMPDAQGNMWFGTPFNNKVGYFIPPEPEKMAQR